MPSFSNLIVDHPTQSGLIVAGLIVVLGLCVYGLGDLLRFTPKRVWAIGGVVFRENIRRKILWLTPLVMLGIVVLSGLQKADDELDAIRQTVQMALFASGMLVGVTGVMLSCTNLPRDIETKIIFTIVTKPTTRLEIILGKIVGFARVTGAILVLMGLFTWGYVHVRAWQLGHVINAELARPDMDEFARGRLEHHQREGLLDTRKLQFARAVETLAREIAPNSDVRWASTQQSLVVPFITPPGGFPALSPDPSKNPNGPADIHVQLKIRGDQIGKVEKPQAVIHAPMIADPAIAAAGPYGNPEFNVSFQSLDNEQEFIPASALNSNHPFNFPHGSADAQTMDITIDGKYAALLNSVSHWGVVISPANENYLIGMNPGDASASIPGPNGAAATTLTPYAGPDGKQLALYSLGSIGRTGRLLEGPHEGYHAVSISRFEGETPRPSSTGNVVLELTMDIERIDDDASVDTTQVEVHVVNRSTGQSTQTLYVTPEKKKTAYAEFPASAFEGGKYDVVLRTSTRGHAVSLDNRSIAVVESRHSFGVNLAKSLIAQWMLSCLVVTIGMFCSTFLSWPIAIVLNIVLLMGHWAVDQVSDSLQPGIGAQLATNMTDPTQARVISTTFDGLARALNFMSQFLPDIDAFSTTDLVQRGLLIPLPMILSAGLVLLLFGLPLLTLSYVILRNEEVAP